MGSKSPDMSGARLVGSGTATVSAGSFKLITTSSAVVSIAPENTSLVREAICDSSTAERDPSSGIVAGSSKLAMDCNDDRNGITSGSSVSTTGTMGIISERRVDKAPGGNLVVVSSEFRADAMTGSAGATGSPVVMSGRGNGKESAGSGARPPVDVGVGRVRIDGRGPSSLGTAEASLPETERMLSSADTKGARGAGTVGGAVAVSASAPGGPLCGFKMVSRTETNCPRTPSPPVSAATPGWLPVDTSGKGDVGVGRRSEDRKPGMDKPRMPNLSAP